MSKPILLVNPLLGEESTTEFFIMPMGLLSIAAYVRNLGEVPKVIDLNIVERKSCDVVESFENMLKEEEPLLVGVTVMIAEQLQMTRVILQKVKAIYPNVLTVIGGANSTQFSEEILTNCPEVDIVVLSEGEHQMEACIEYAKTGVQPNWPDGIAYRKGETIVRIPKASYIRDINELPDPAYDLLNFDDYGHDTSTWHNPYNVTFGTRVPIVTSRGCPNQCNFCSVDSCMGCRHRSLSASRVVDMIQTLCDEHGAYYIAVFDANFTQSVSRVIEICNEINKRNIDICLDLPTGIPINKSSREMIEALVSAGMIRTGISIESGDVYIRNDIMKKNVAEEDIYTIIEEVRRFPHLHLLVDFVLGMPEDTVEGLESSCKLIETIDVDSIALSIATPYPLTPLYDQCVSNDLFFDDVDYRNFWKGKWYTHANLSRFIIKPPNLTLGELFNYRDRILNLRDEKVKLYKKRMKNLFDVDSKFEPERKRIRI